MVEIGDCPLITLDYGSILMFPSNAFLRQDAYLVCQVLELLNPGRLRRLEKLGSFLVGSDHVRETTIVLVQFNVFLSELCDEFLRVLQSRDQARKITELAKTAIGGVR